MQRKSSPIAHWASGFCSQAGGFCPVLARQASEVPWKNVRGNSNYRRTGTIRDGIFGG